MICSLKHLPTGHLVVLMEKMKYALLKTQSTEMRQSEDYSFHLSEVLRHQNKAVCSVRLLLCPPVCGSSDVGRNAGRGEPV